MPMPHRLSAHAAFAGPRFAPPPPKRRRTWGPPRRRANTARGRRLPQDRPMSPDPRLCPPPSAPQDSLGGNARTVLMCHGSVSPANAQETLSTLHFASRAKNIQNKPRQNKEMTMQELTVAYKKVPLLQRCIRREGTWEAAPEAVWQGVGGGCQSGWGRLLSVTNAVEAGTWRQA